MILHLKEEHQLPLEIEETTFENSNNFLDWKETLEKETHSQYVLHCAPVKKEGEIISYYYCNRAGGYKSKGAGLRQLKTQGSAKINNQCSAHMKVTENFHKQYITVKYCSAHYNHDTKFAYLRMPERTRLDIASKLQKGVTTERILDDIRQELEGGLGREHLINRQDIRNIRLQYNIEGIHKHSNDLSSVAAWVTEIKNCDHTSVLAFKAQGLEQPNTMDNLSNDDFILCIQTPFQRDMFLKFGNDTICIDSTHGTNMYDFYLVTVLVIDEYGEGIQVAWMISNREDKWHSTYFSLH